MLEGRLFERSDGASSPPVIVITATLARQFFTQSPLGYKIRVGGPDAPWSTIIGVVADVHERGYEPAIMPGVYIPIVQTPNASSVPRELIVRAQDDSASRIEAIRRVIHTVNPRQPMSRIRTMQELLDSDVADRTQLMAAWCVCSISLAACLHGPLWCPGLRRNSAAKRDRRTDRSRCKRHPRDQDHHLGRTATDPGRSDRRRRPFLADDESYGQAIVWRARYRPIHFCRHGRSIARRRACSMLDSCAKGIAARSYSDPARRIANLRHHARLQKAPHINGSEGRAVERGNDTAACSSENTLQRLKLGPVSTTSKWSPHAVNHRVGLFVRVPGRIAGPAGQLTGVQPGLNRLRVVSQDYHCTDSRGVAKHLRPHERRQ